MFPPPVCPTRPSSIWSFASPLCLWLRTMRWQQIRRQEILLSIKLAILPARMTYMLPLAWPLCQRSLPRRCSLKMKAPSFSSFQAKHLPYMLLFHSGDSLQQATQRSSQASRAFGLEELLQERERESLSSPTASVQGTPSSATTAHSFHFDDDDVLPANKKPLTFYHAQAHAMPQHSIILSPPYQFTLLKTFLVFF